MPAARVAGLTETPMVLGVVPLVVLTESYVADDVESVKLIALPVLLVIEMFCDAGTVPPCVKPNASVEGLTTKRAVVLFVTLKVTGTVIEPALDETATEALYVPTGKPLGFTETPIELGVVPLVRLIASRLADDFESVKLMAVLVLLVTDKLWDAGVDPPC